MANTFQRLKFGSIRLLHRIIELIASGFFWLIHRDSRNKVPPIDNLLLLDSATTLALKIRTKKVTSEEVVQSYINRIKEVNPVLNCVVDERFDEALEDARKVDELITSGSKSAEDIARETPFLGVPFTTKDCIQVKGLSNTAGLYRRKDIKAANDAEVISLMRKSGAIPLAITNVSELCMWWESTNTVHGRTNNPYDTNHIVGGSSGGEACVLAAAASPFGIGSDIGGSIRMPAFFNGIFGHKPTTGFVSNQGEYPVPTEEQNTFLGTGPMCRFASDLLPMYKVLVGNKAEFLKLDERVDVSKLKFYYMENDGGGLGISPVDPEIKSALRKVISHFERAYGIQAQKVQIKKMKLSAPIWLAKMRTTDGPDFCQQLANLEGSINIYTEFVKWIFGLSQHTFVALATAITEKWGVQPGSEQYNFLYEACSLMQTEFQYMLGNDGVFLYPTHPTPAPYHVEPIIKPLNFSYTGIINMLGLPATHCPLGLNQNGLPIGIQVIAGLTQDRLTIAVANDLEKAFGGWVPPSVAV